MLVVSRRLLTNSVPDVVGGGTVSYVNPQEHRYILDPAHREEGGTPAIVESIRAGLVFALKDAVGVATIRAHEEDFLRRAVTAWREHPAIEVLGNPDAERLSIVSFVVRRPGGRYLHHNLVVSILNDLFGIQSRGGCSCAGPYGHRLLGIDLERSHEFEREITGGCEGIKPGWVRINFNYFVSEAVFEYVVRAVALVADHGHKLAPQYSFDPMTGLWQHRAGPVEPPLRLTHLSYDADGVLTYPREHDTAPESALAGYLERGGRAVRLAARRRQPGRRRRAGQRRLRAPALVRPAGGVPGAQPAACVIPRAGGSQVNLGSLNFSAVATPQKFGDCPYAVAGGAHGDGQTPRAGRDRSAEQSLQVRPQPAPQRGIRLRGAAVHQVRGRRRLLAGQQHAVPGPRVA